MTNMSQGQVVRKTESLRDARKSFTRDQIIQASREVFAEHGFAAATLEQIAVAAGTRRSTVYNHFRNKDDILGAIGEEYCDGLIAIIDDLPGPMPSRAEIDQWLESLVEFTARERTPTVLLMSLSGQFGIPDVVEVLNVRLLTAMALRFAAFRQAVEPGPQQGLARARASVVMQQLGQACLHRIRGNNPDYARDVLTVAADLFESLIKQGADQHAVLGFG